ncbi:MAG TPA: hypothetical protein DFR83_26035, partial [Deltaproteobacteria bacterium]|nr:hypothetical protein [Deltaproteobacteria bacterium]
MTKFRALASVGVVSILLQGCAEDESGKPDDEGTPAEAYEGDDDGECSDGVDNDRNGLFDCDDPGCTGAPDCASSGEGEGEGEG